MSDSYAVMGNPIAHSLSPRIHAEFARQTGQDMVYRAILVALDDFPGAVDRFRSQQGRGLNVTVPFKQQAWALAGRRTPRAERAGAVNTLWFEHATVHGDNTDGAGLVADLERNNGCVLAGRSILLLGAGGAARGVLAPLLAADPSRLVIVNRTVARAHELAGLYASDGRVAGCGYDELRGSRFDLVINATAASLGGELPPLVDGLVNDGGWCYDMMYGKTPTPFLRWAASQGIEQRLDGLGMLVEQAAEAFLVWRGVRPPTGELISRLRDALA